MRVFASKNIRALVGLAVALSAAGLVIAASTASGQGPTVTRDLCAVTGNVNLPGSATPIPIWGFVDKGTAADCSGLTATLPGPVLVVPTGTDLQLNVTNALPAGHTLSFEIPGLSGGMDIAVGATGSRTFPTFGAPGTYLYQSGGDAGRQEAMGLYGALIVRAPDIAPGRLQAYDASATEYEVEAPLVLSQLDPAFNADPDGFNMYKYKATYWLINGKAYSASAPPAPIAATAGQRVLLRYVNAGSDNTTMLLLGMHERVLARDAGLLNSPFDADAETIPAGGTEDVIATVPSSAPPTPNGFPIYNRQLHVTNGNALLSAGPPPVPNPDHTPGGMLTFIKVPLP